MSRRTMGRTEWGELGPGAHVLVVVVADGGGWRNVSKQARDHSTTAPCFTPLPQSRSHQRAAAAAKTRSPA